MGPREQISTPGPRRFAPAQAPKFLPSIQSALGAGSGAPISNTRPSITSKFSIFANLGGNEGGIDALFALTFHRLPPNSQYPSILEVIQVGLTKFSGTQPADYIQIATSADLGGNVGGIDAGARSADLGGTAGGATAPPHGPATPTSRGTTATLGKTSLKK